MPTVFLCQRPGDCPDVAGRIGDRLRAGLGPRRVIAPLDLGSTDANIAISLGIPAIAAGTVLSTNQHQLEENAQASSIVPGIKQLITLAVVLTTH